MQSTGNTYGGLSERTCLLRYKQQARGASNNLQIVTTGKTFDRGSLSGRVARVDEAARIEARKTLRELLIAEQLRDPDSASCQTDAGNSCHRLTLIPFYEPCVRRGSFSETRSEGPARCLSCVFEIEYAEGGWEVLGIG